MANTRTFPAASSLIPSFPTGNRGVCILVSSKNWNSSSHSTFPVRREICFKTKLKPADSKAPKVAYRVFISVAQEPLAAPGDAVKIGNNFLFKESKNAILNGLLGVCKALNRKAQKKAGIYLTKVKKYPGIPS